MKQFIIQSGNTYCIYQKQSSMDIWAQTLCLQFLTGRKMVIVLFHTPTKPCLHCFRCHVVATPTHAAAIHAAVQDHIFFPASLFNFAWCNLILEKGFGKFTSFCETKPTFCRLVSKIHFQRLSYIWLLSIIYLWTQLRAVSNVYFLSFANFGGVWPTGSWTRKLISFAVIMLSELTQAYIDIIYITFVLNDMPCLPPRLYYQLLEK